jgi:HK97 family phage major capsid protein
MSTKLKELKEKRGLLIPQARAASDALTADPTNADKQKAWNERSNEITLLNGEIEREERVSALEALAPDKRGTLPGGTPPGGTKPGDDPLADARSKEPDNPVLDPDKHGYSLLRAMRMQCGLEPQGGVEWEIHTELSKNRNAAGATVRGVMVPHTLRMRGAQLRGTVTGLTAGAGLIPTILAPTLIDILRDRVVLRSLGCQVLSDMVGAFKIPKKTAKIGFEWVAEATAATATDVTVGTVDFSEKTLTGWTKITRSFMKQSSQDAELLVRNDLIDGMAVGLDNGGINGTGSSNQPTGLLAVSGTNSVAIGTNGGAITWAKAIELQTAVGTANAVGNRPAYLTNSKVMGAMKTIPKVASTSIFIMEDGQVDGRDVAECNLVPSNLTKGSSSGVCSALLYGDFSNLIMALWGGLDIVVDPYTLSTAGDVRVTAFQSADVNVRYAAAFSKCVDLTT